MFHSQGSSKQTCTLLVVTCGKLSESNRKKDVLDDDRPVYPFLELTSSGRLEVKIESRPDLLTTTLWLFVESGLES